MKKICRRCINHRINIKSRKVREKLFNKILLYFRERMVTASHQRMARVAPSTFEVTTAGGLRGRQASSASWVGIATRKEESIATDRLHGGRGGGEEDQVPFL